MRGLFPVLKTRVMNCIYPVFVLKQHFKLFFQKQNIDRLCHNIAVAFDVTYKDDVKTILYILLYVYIYFLRQIFFIWCVWYTQYSILKNYTKCRCISWYVRQWIWHPNLSAAYGLGKKKPQKPKLFNRLGSLVLEKAAIVRVLQYLPNSSWPLFCQ